LGLFLKIEQISHVLPVLYSHMPIPNPNCEVHMTEDDQIIIAVIIYYSSVIKNNGLTNIL